MDKKLTDNQRKFMINLLSSSSIGEASEKTGIATSTGYGYMRDEFFLKEYEELKREKFKQATDRIVGLVDNGTAVMKEIINDENESGATRVNAVKAVWANAFKTYEMQEVEERLDELKEMIEELKR